MKEFAVVVNMPLKFASLHEFSIEQEGSSIKSLKNDFIHQCEYHEYMRDNENWLPLQKWVDHMGILNHWSKVKTIRLKSKIIIELAIIEDDEMVWIYRRQS